MRARKCDRCNCFYDSYCGNRANDENANSIIFIDRDNENKYWTRNVYDLCPECMKAVILFIYGAEDN